MPFREPARARPMGRQRTGPGHRLALGLGLGVLLGATGVAVLSVLSSGPGARPELVALAAALGLAGLAVVVGARLAARRRAAEQPADHSEPAVPGWVARTLGEHGARYDGEYRGRALQVMRVYRKHDVGPATLKLSSPVATRVAWARRPELGAAIDRLAGAPPVDGAAHGYPGVELVLHEPAWARALLADPGVHESVARLFDAGWHGAETVLLTLRPGALFLSLATPGLERLDAPACKQLLEAMCVVLEAAEALPAPAERLERTRLERLADDPRGALKVTIALLGCLVLFSVAAVTVMLLVLPSR